MIDSRRIEVIALNIISAFLWASFSLIGIRIYNRISEENTDASFLTLDLPVPLWLYFGSYFLMLLPPIFLFWLYKTRWNVTIRGRNAIMESNLKLLRRRNTLKPEQSVIYSTRFALWPTIGGEDTSAATLRSLFRDELDQAATKERRELRRIWLLRNSEDVERLVGILDKYRGFSNVTIKYFMSTSAFPLPEILVIGNRFASLSFPQTRLPNSFDASQVFRDKNSVEAIRNYFDVLWAEAQDVLVSGERDLEREKELDELFLK